MNKEENSIVVVFDLDDTLYFEKDYRESGYNAVIEYLVSLYSVTRVDLVKTAEAGGDVLQALANLVGVPSVKESLLWVYRLHKPNISLTQEAEHILKLLAERNVTTLILTDGRSVSQRMKLKSLGLENYPAFISDEFDGAVKPNLKRFKYIEESYPLSKFVYVGDNPKKDFIAPNKLGWLTIGLKSHPSFIHNHKEESHSKEFLPKFWVKDLYEVEKYLC